MAENISVNGVTYNGVDTVEFETPEGKSVGFYPDAVRYNAQELTEEQRAQARENIGVKSGTEFTTDETLTLENGVLRVNTAHEPEPDNTLPITAAAVATTVGNIEIILKTI